MTDNVKVKTGKRNKPVSKKPVNRVPTEIEEIVKIVKYNANLKRHTALNIITRFVEDGFIDNAKGAFVDFLWDKYTVKHNNITKGYTYDKTFVEALVKAHEDMAKENIVSINKFLKYANID